MTSYQISLFFVNNTIYKIDKVSKELLQEIEELKEPILIPQEVNAPREVNIPVIIFDKNAEIRLLANFHTMIITVIKKDGFVLKDLMEKVYSVLENNEIKVVRIGFVYNSSLENANIESFKKQKIIDDEIINSKDFELSWLKAININDIDVNCWQRYYTIDGKDILNTTFDINTKADENNKVDREFMEIFIIDAEKYVMDNIFC